MILHPDGTIEGTPEEVAAYEREFDLKAKLSYQADLVRHALQKAEPGSMIPADKHGIPILDDATSTSVDIRDGGECLRLSRFAHILTAELIAALNGRTGVKHVKAHKGKGVAITIEGEMCADFITADETKDFQYILIERHNPAN